MVNPPRRLLTTIALSIGVSVVAGAGTRDCIRDVQQHREKSGDCFCAQGCWEPCRAIPFDALGRSSGGVNDPLEAQRSLALSPDHTLLFAVNADSGDITVFRAEEHRPGENDS